MYVQRLCSPSFFKWNEGNSKRITPYIVFICCALTVTVCVEVQPSPVATVTEGATLWLTCTYDLTGGTLGQLLWRDKDNINAATVFPTSNPPCVAPSDSYSIDCSNLASNEVRLGILNPVHGDTYSCTVYLSDSTKIGPVSTQVFVVVPVNSVTFTTPVSDTAVVTPGNSQVYTCVTGSCRPAARIEWYKDDVNITTQTGSVSSTGGDKFVTTSSLTLTGTRGDTTPATVQCRASNVDGMSPVVSADKTFVVQWAPDGPPVITGYTSVTILYVNDTLPLQCRQSGGNPRAILTWGGVCGGIPPTNSNTQTEAVSDITITVTKGYNKATCTCVSSHPQPQTQDRTQVTFTVHFGPDSVSITGNRVIVADDTNTLTLNCTTQEYNRHVHIMWYNSTSQIPNPAVVTNTSGTNGGYISTQVLQLTPDRYQDGNVIRCVVKNEDVKIGQKTGSVTLNLNYLPSSAVSVSVNPITEGRENSTVDLTCEVTGGKPAPSLQWTCPPSVYQTSPITGSQGDRHTSVITVTLTRQANNQRCNCIGSQADTTWTGSDQSPVLTVRFGPNRASITGNRVIVADGTNTLTLNCTTQEYNRHVHIAWYNGTTQISNTAVVTNTSGTYGGYISTQVLQLTPDRYQNGNVIRCVVQNEDTELGKKTASVTLSLNYHPRSAVSVTVNPTTEGRENSTVDLTCEVTGGKPTPSLLWTCPSSVSTTGPIIESLEDRHTSVITVTLSRQANNQRCNCMGSQADTAWTESDQSPVFIVRFGPDSVGIAGNRMVVANGTNTLSLTCTTQEYNRHAHITWYNGTTQIPNTAAVTNTSGTYGGYISTQVLQLTPDRYQDGNVIRCSVQNEDETIAETTAEVALNISYRPYLTLTPTLGVNVIEGGELEIRCDVDSNPPSSITWTREGGQLPSNSDVTSGVLRIPSTHRTDKGRYMCTAENSVSREQESINIDIHYPPDIRVTYTNTTYNSSDRTFTCVPDGNPDTYQFGLWRHTSEDGTEIRQLTGDKNLSQSVLTLSDPGVTKRYQDTGFYICKVSNDIPEPFSYRSSSVFFVVEAPPVVITNTSVVKGQIGDNITLETEFYSRPEVTPASNITWTKGTDRSSPPERSVTSLNSATIATSFYSIAVNVKGYVATIAIHDLEEQDFENYTLTIENDIGRTEYTIWLKSASPPFPPKHLASLIYDSSSITVEWTPNFDGGAEQVFVIGYKSDVSADFVNLAPIEDKHVKTQSYQITGLKPSSMHFIRMFAKNELGSSDFVFLNQTTTAAIEAGSSIGLLAGGIAGSAVGLIVIIAIAVVIYKRRSNAKDEDMEMIASPSKPPEDDDLDGLKPNILYESSDGLKANVLYESAGADFQPQPGPSSEYAVVCKPKKKNGATADPNSLYAVVDKSNKDEKKSNDVYAEVVKQPKDKDEKGKKKQPVGKKKQPKGGKKVKKSGHGNADKQKDHGNDRDVYENVSSVTGKEDTLYANSADSTKPDLRPSRTRNQDGLVYLEVEFTETGNGQRRAVIHGIENRNDYADIDFSKRADPLPDENDEETAGKADDEKIN